MKNHLLYFLNTFFFGNSGYIFQCIYYTYKNCQKYTGEFIGGHEQQMAPVQEQFMGPLLFNSLLKSTFLFLANPSCILQWLLINK